MKIINDCIKENTLFLEIGGTCHNVSQLFLNIKDKFNELNGKIEDMQKCCKSNNDRLIKLEECCRRIQKIIFNWKQPVFYPGSGGTTFPAIVSNIQFTERKSIRTVPHNFRGLEFRRVNGDPPDKFGPKNTKYYTEKELNPLRARLKKLGYKKYV